MNELPEVILSSQEILNIGGVSITNSILATLMVSVIIILFGMIVLRKPQILPSRIQVAMEGLISFFLDSLEQGWEDNKRARLMLPVIIALFIFLLIANQFGVIPLVTSMVLEGDVSLFRTPTSDFSLPLAMALVMVGSAHLIALSMHPIRHIGNFIKIGEIFKIRKFSDIGNAFLEIFLGLLDIIGEFAKIVSLTCRLFGNVFAGEVMVMIVTALGAYFISFPYFFPMPFIVLSMFSGLVQAFVFVLLSMNFMIMTVKGAEPEKA